VIQQIGVVILDCGNPHQSQPRLLHAHHGRVALPHADNVPERDAAVQDALRASLRA
jgi:hypothetical protein